MYFTDDFLSYLVSPPRISPEKPADSFLGNIYETNNMSVQELPSVLAGGSLEAVFPYSYHLNPLNCYILLYTESGYGKLHLENSVYSLESNTLLFIKSDQKFKLEIAISPWNYKIFFLVGKALDFFYQILPDDNFPLFTIPEYSPIIRSIQKLTLNNTSSGIHNKLYDSRLLNDIFCDLLMDTIEADHNAPKIPAYLQEMKALFDIDYQVDYSLDELEEHFNISKYRLCREFHSFFGEPPLQYLNGKRVELARDLLLTTDYRIHEVGSLVGIDNTNHFIYLFKKKTGLTPLAFKKKALNN